MNQDPNKKKRSPSQAALLMMAAQQQAGAGGPGRGEGGRALLPGMRPGQANAAGNQEQGLEMVPVDKLKDDSGKLAETTLPRRMVVVTAAFPYQAQLEEFRKALRFTTVDDMLRDPAVVIEFAGFDVQRRTVGKDGKIVNDWADLDVDTPMKAIRVQAVGVEKDDPQLDNYGLIVRPNRLVMPEPKLAYDQTYPQPKLESIVEAAAAVEKAAQGDVPPPKRRATRFEEVDIYDENPDDAQRGTGNVRGENANTAEPRGLPGSKLPGPGSKIGGKPVPLQRPSSESGRTGEQANRAEIVPPHCLVRFIDTDPSLRPGFAYEYQIRIRMANPIHGQTERAASRGYTQIKEIVGPWQPVTWTVDKEGKKETVSKVAIPDELEFFATDEKPMENPALPVANQDRAAAKPDQVAVQIHRWLDFARTKYAQAGSEVPIGSWSILERTLVNRGEYIGRIAEVAVPYFATTLDHEAFAVSPDEQRQRRTLAGGTQTRTHKHKGIPVDFATDPVTNTPSLLVDFDGGERSLSPPDRQPVKITGPVEMLVLSSDGKLIVHNSRDDTENAARKERHEAWKANIQRVLSRAEEKSNNADSLFGPGKRPPGKGGS
jgi:hypothetical protein